MSFDAKHQAGAGAGFDRHAGIRHDASLLSQALNEYLYSQSNPDVWRKKVGPTQKLYSWAMNNHWGTNYRAYQEGPHVFRFLLRPHRGWRLRPASRCFWQPPAGKWVMRLRA